jgi:hypothetical protein
MNIFLNMQANKEVSTPVAILQTENFIKKFISFRDVMRSWIALRKKEHLDA